MSQLGQGRLWLAGGWHSGSIPSSGNTRAFWHYASCQEEKCDLTARCSATEGFYLPQVFCVSALLISSCFRINTGRSHRPNSFFDIVRSEAASKYYWGTNTLHYLSTDAPVMRHALRADLHITSAMTVKQDPIDNSIICLRHTYRLRSGDRYAAHEFGL
jgi:hypothetical protein